MDEKLYAKALMTFDHTYEPKIEMYDHLPYSRDVDLCDWKTPRVLSGNVVKFYQYQLGKPQIIQNDFIVEIEEPEQLDEELIEEEPSNDLGSLLVDESAPVENEEEIDTEDEVELQQS